MPDTDLRKMEVPARDARFVVEPLLAPKDHWGACVEWYKRGPRGGAKRWTRVGPYMVERDAGSALSALIIALERDVVPGLRMVGGRHAA